MKKKRTDKATPEQQKARHNRLRYKLEPHEYQQMFIDQDYKCYICSKPHGNTRGTTLYVDHNHKTGKVRKLLCAGCNQIAGKIEHERYEMVLEYLKEHNEAK